MSLLISVAMVSFFGALAVMFGVRVARGDRESWGGVIVTGFIAEMSAMMLVADLIPPGPWLGIWGLANVFAIIAVLIICAGYGRCGGK